MLINLELILNILIHVLVLLTLLYIFFWTFITKNQTKIVNDEIEEVTNNIFLQISNNLTKEQKVEVNQKINKVTPLLNVLSNSYDKKNKNVQLVNNCIRRSNLTAIILILILVLSIYLVSTFICKKEINFFEILKENAVTLSIIGIIEYLFFKEIASKYTPISPGFIYENFYNYLQKKLL